VARPSFKGTQIKMIKVITPIKINTACRNVIDNRVIFLFLKYWQQSNKK
jgi:hypothetical protein